MKKKCLLVILWISLIVVLGTVTAYAGGKILGANVEVTSGAGFETGYPDVAANDDTIYAVWIDDRDVYDMEDIYLSISTDGGATWGANVSFSGGLDNEIGLDDPAVAAYPNGWVHVVWFNPYPSMGGDCNYETCVYMAATQDGTSFDRWALWGSNDDSYYIEPQLAIDSDSGDMVVAVSDYVGSGAGGENIHGLVWDYAGGTWRTPIINDQAGSATSSAGVLDGSRMAATARDNVSCIAWEDARDGTMRIYGDCTTDHGQSWGTDFAISSGGTDASLPSLALASDSSLYAAYEMNGEIYLRRSTNRGVTWSSAKQVSNSGDNELGLWDMDVDDNGTVAVVWAVGDWGSFGSSSLYLSTSIDQGQTFTHVRADDGGEIYSQYSPAITAYGSGTAARAVMVWEDDRNARDEIWSARAELDAIPPTAPGNLQATPGDTVVDLTWDAATDANGVAGYYVIRAEQSGGPYTVLNPNPINATAYRDVGLDGTRYYYKVFAKDNTGNVGNASNEVSAVVTVGTDLPVDGTLAYEVGTDVRLNDLPTLSNERTLAQGARPQFAADGQRVYYTGSDIIHSRKLDSSDPQTYYSDSDFHGEFDIAQDNDAYFAWIQEKQYSQTSPYASWTVFEPHYGTGGATDYVDSHEFADSPTLSADRQFFAYTSLGHHAPNRSVYSYDHVSLCIADLGTEGRIATHSDVHYWDPAFAPSGDTLAFAAYFTGQYEIWTASVNADGTLSNLTQLTRGAEGEWSLAPSWSSDGNWLVFTRDTPGGAADPEAPELQDPELYIVQSDGTSLRSLGIGGDLPAWYGSGSAPPCVSPTGSDFYWTPQTLGTGETADFTAVGGRGTAPFTFMWDFGDGEHAQGARVAHTYVQNGTHTVTFTVTNACGTETLTHDVLVSGTPLIPTYGVSLTPATQSREVGIGNTTVYTQTLRNTGDVADTFTLTANSTHGWATLSSADAVNLAPDAETQIMVRVTVPTGTDVTHDVVTVQAVSWGNPMVQAQVTSTTTIVSHKVYLPLTLRN